MYQKKFNLNGKHFIIKTDSIYFFLSFISPPDKFLQQISSLSILHTSRRILWKSANISFPEFCKTITFFFLSLFLYIASFWDRFGQCKYFITSALVAWMYQHITLCKFRWCGFLDHWSRCYDNGITNYFGYYGYWELFFPFPNVTRNKVKPWIFSRHLFYVSVWDRNKYSKKMLHWHCKNYRTLSKYLTLIYD